MAFARIEPLEGRMLLTTAVPGFTEETFASGLSQPTTMSFAPDGRLFVSEQKGTLRVIKDGQLQATPFLSLNVDTAGERGLLGIAFDPDFATNQYVYVYWTAKSPTIHNVVSRFAVSAENPDVASAASRTDLMVLPDLGPTNHNGGALHFGPDGKLYVAVGENGTPPRSQDVNTPFGKLLRINKDGTIPTDNPFYASNTGLGRAVWATGLRNPFSFAFQPGSGKMFINDVGQDTWEEINEGVVGANYGWPTTEGPTTDARFRSPLHWYKHEGDETVSGGVITGSTFYNPAPGVSAAFPSAYTGKYFYGDGIGRYVKFIDPANPAQATPFARGVSYPVDMDVGPDGALYVLSRNGGYNATEVLGRVLRYAYSESGAPSIGNPPASQVIALGETATFTVDASGGENLSYQWQRNGGNIPGATAATYTLSGASLDDNGAIFTVIVSNGAGSVTSAPATLTVVNGVAPAPVITLPATGALFTAGQPVAFAGSASDAEDGVLPPDKLTWSVSYFTGGLERPFLPEANGIANGSFTPETITPYLQTDVFYRVRLAATDSSGLVRSTFVDVLPRVSDITIQSSVPGLTLELDGVPVKAPYTVAGVAGLTRPLAAPLRQTLDGVIYDFAAWSDGGTAAHDLSTPEAGGTYTAEYRPRVSMGAGPDLSTAAVDASAAAAVSGDTGKAVVRINNPGNERFRGRVAIDLYLSSDTTLDEGDTLATTVTRNLNIAAGGGRNTRLKFTYPSVAGGNYYLLAETDSRNAATEADELNNAAAAAVPTPVTPLTIDLSGELNAGPASTEPVPLARGQKLKAVLDISNTGNTTAKGRLDVVLKLAIDAAGANATEVAAIQKRLNLRPNRATRLKMTYRLPDSLPAGTYRLLAVIDPAGAFADVDVADNTVVDAATYDVV